MCLSLHHVRTCVHACVCVCELRVWGACACVCVCVCVCVRVSCVCFMYNYAIFIYVCWLGCECFVVESYFNYFLKCMNGAKPTSIPCVLLPLGCNKTYDLCLIRTLKCAKRTELPGCHYLPSRVNSLGYHCFPPTQRPSPGTACRTPPWRWWAGPHRFSVKAPVSAWRGWRCRRSASATPRPGSPRTPQARDAGIWQRRKWTLEPAMTKWCRKRH